MITSIQLRNVSSYSPTSTITIGSLKRVSVFYGQNGTGKTTAITSKIPQMPASVRASLSL